MSKELKQLSVVIPARDESACIANTVEHLHLELSLQKIPHEIIVVDDGSSDETSPYSQRCRRKFQSSFRFKVPGHMVSVVRSQEDWIASRVMPW